MISANMRARLYPDALPVNTRAHNLSLPACGGDNAQMNRRKRNTPLAFLMERDGLSDNGLARLLEMKQPTISRIASGVSRDPDEATLEPIARYFNVTTAYLRGKDPLSLLIGRGEDALSPLAQDIGRKWQSLSAERQELFRDLIFTMHYMEKRFPAMKKGRPKGESYTNLERAIEQDMRQLSLPLEAKKP